MQLLKNNTKTTAPAEEFNEPADSEVGGLAAAFTPEEVKKLFFSYLITILSIEGLIFFLCYVYLLATDSIAFPWKPYLFATFIAPVATTFIFGLILVVFNRFFFNEAPPSYESLRSVTPGFGAGKGDRAATFFHVVHRLPILFSMFLLLVVVGLMPKRSLLKLGKISKKDISIHFLSLFLMKLIQNIFIKLKVSAKKTT